MDPEKKKALDKLVHRERLALVGIPLAILLVIGGVVGFLYMPHEHIGDVEARIERFFVVPSDGPSTRMMLLRMPDGGVVRFGVTRSDNQLAPGALVCLAKTQHPVMRTVSYRRVPDTRCGG